MAACNHWPAGLSAFDSRFWQMRKIDLVFRISTVDHPPVSFWSRLNRKIRSHGVQKGVIYRSNLPSRSMEKLYTCGPKFWKSEFSFRSYDFGLPKRAFCKFFFGRFLTYLHRRKQNFANLEGNGRPPKIDTYGTDLWKVSASIGSDQHGVSVCEFATFVTFWSP